MNHKHLLPAALLLALACAGAGAQTAPPAPPPVPANPLDAVPEKMPFDVPYGAPIGLQQAEAVLNAALAEAAAKGWKVSCAVVDSGANLVALKRMDGAQLASLDAAPHKARSSAKYRRETKVFETAVQGGFVAAMTLDDAIAARGGVPLVQAGRLVGAIGCGGGTGSQDEVAAKAGAALVK